MDGNGHVFKHTLSSSYDDAVICAKVKTFHCNFRLAVENFTVYTYIYVYVRMYVYACILHITFHDTNGLIATPLMEILFPLAVL